MSSSDVAAALSAEEHQYYMATAMLTTAYEYGRNGDAELWWSTFRPAFVSCTLLVRGLLTSLL